MKIKIVFISILLFLDCLIYGMSHSHSPNYKLLIGVEQENIKLVREALEEGADINAEYANGQTALIIVASNVFYRAPEKIIKLLLNYGAGLDFQDELGSTALINAVKEGKTNVIKLLLDAGADIYILDNSDNTALDYAVKLQNRDIMKLLSKYIIDKNARNQFVNQFEEEYKAKLKEEELANAVECCDIKVAGELLAAGVNPNVKGKFGYFLSQAISKKYMSMIKLLLNYKANPNLFIHYLDMTSLGGTYSYHTIFSCAIKEMADKDIIKLLLGFGADPNIQDSSGLTALMQAILVNDKEKKLEYVKLLLDYGALLDLKNNQGRTALDIAWRRNDQDVVCLITEEYEKRRKLREQVKSEIDKLECLLPELTDIISEYVIIPKK